MDNYYEVRHCTELRATEDGRLEGYAALYNSRSVDLGGLVEVIAPGAFDRTLRENPDILALVEHDVSKVIGRTANGTLRIIPDERGLRVEIDPANTSAGRDIVELVRRGDVAGMSFRFKPYPGGTTLDMSQKPPVRTLRSILISEVSVVVDPAYPDASVALRDVETARRVALNLKHKGLKIQLLEKE
jgi:uncharacterized protein